MTILRFERSSFQSMNLTSQQNLSAIFRLVFIFIRLDKENPFVVPLSSHMFLRFTASGQWFHKQLCFLPTDWTIFTVQKVSARGDRPKKREQFYYFHVPSRVPTSLSDKPFFCVELPECFFACLAEFTRASWSNHYIVDRIWKGSMEV